MKNLYFYIVFYISSIFNICFSQTILTHYNSSSKNNNTTATDTKITTSPISIRVINSFLVEEIINQKFGGHITTYEVSKVNLINSNDLGPNNFRRITPIYGEKKIISKNTFLLQKELLKSVPQQTKNSNSKHLEETEAINENKSLKTDQYIYVNLINTYERIAEKGYKSIEIYQKLGDYYFFKENYNKAARWYKELIKMNISLESEYYSRYEFSLDQLKEIKKNSR